MTEIQKNYSPLLSDKTKQYSISGYDPIKRKVITSANRLGNTGILLVGSRHWDKLMHRQYEEIKKNTIVPMNDIEMGFIDQFGQFMTRSEAYDIAHFNGQELIGEDWGELYSENLH